MTLIQMIYKITEMIKAVLNEFIKDWRWYLCWIAIGSIMGWISDSLWETAISIILMGVVVWCIVYIVVQKNNERHEKQKLNT